MGLAQAAVLGVVQGVAELLPISSSAHLALVPVFTGWPDQGLAYDIALHWGTLLALGFFFWKDWIRFAKAGLRREDSQERRIFDGILLATIPGALAGLFLQDLVETVFRTPVSIGLLLAFFGLILAGADWVGRKDRTMASFTWKDCLIIGAAQSLAVMPGVSRSGVTMTVALLLGVNRVDSARFSFLMAVPIVFGAGVVKLKDLPPGSLDPAFWTGIFISCVTGLIAIRFLLGFLRKGSLVVFGVYRVILGLLVILLFAAGITGSGEKKDAAAPRTSPELSASALRLRQDVRALAGEIGTRGAYETEKVHRARSYIKAQLREAGYAPSEDAYEVRHMGHVPNGSSFHNIRVETGEPRPEEGIWVVGAHYDTAPRTPGADDNASGVAVLLELARALKAVPPRRRVRLVAFGTEEPPAYGTRSMGSWHDAKVLSEAGARVEGMLCLEMLGYFDEDPGSQKAPPLMGFLLPDKGNFLALVGDLRSRGFLKELRASWRSNTELPLVAHSLPQTAVTRLSDHMNYWDRGFPALMLTDTARFRNPNYHQARDLPETLDFRRMAETARALAEFLRSS